MKYQTCVCVCEGGEPLYSSASVTFQLQQPKQNEIVSVIYRLWCPPLEYQLREIHPVV